MRGLVAALRRVEVRVLVVMKLRIRSSQVAILCPMFTVERRGSTLPRRRRSTCNRMENTWSCNDARRTERFRGQTRDSGIRHKHEGVRGREVHQEDTGREVRLDDAKRDVVRGHGAEGRTQRGRAHEAISGVVEDS